MSVPHHASDRKAAYTGLILGAITLAIVLFSIVQLTNKHFESEKPAAAAAK
jgi:hypothetical protein